MSYSSNLRPFYIYPTYGAEIKIDTKKFVVSVKLLIVIVMHVTQQKIRQGAKDF